MPEMKLSVPHTLGRAGAAERLQKFSDRIREKYKDHVKDFEEEWGDNWLRFGFKTLGAKIQGKLDVEEEAVNFNGELPFAAMMFKGRIEKEIRESLERVLA